MKIHELKIMIPYFNQVEVGIKTFEVRRNDRDFKTGDVLHLRECNLDGYTCNELLASVIYILDNEDYVKKGYVILGIEVINRQ
jgi:uncharacterized protein YqfB (UPF0267 family)